MNEGGIGSNGSLDSFRRPSFTPSLGPISESRKDSIGRISSTESSVSSPVSTPLYSSSKSTEETRQKFINEMQKPHANFEKFSLNIISKLNKLNPEILSEIVKFQKTYATHINLLKEKSWKDWSSEKGDWMTTEPIGDTKMTMAEFRKEAKKFQERITDKACGAAGLDKMKWNAAGTDSYKSDVDNFCSPEDKNRYVSQIDQIATKVISEAVWQKTFDGVASTQIDLESYLDHPGATRNTEAQLKTFEGKKQFTRLEMTMAALDMRRAYENDKAGWEGFKADYLNTISGELRVSYRQVFEQAENFDATLNREIREQMLQESPQYSFSSFEIREMSTERLNQLTNDLLKEDKDAFKKAALTYKTNRTMELSAQMDEDASTISDNIRKMDKLNEQLNQFKDDISKSSIKSQYRKLEKDNDMLEVRIAARGALRNAMFDETYLTQGAYNRICYAEGGQLVTQALQKNIERHRRSSNAIQLQKVEQQRKRSSSQSSLSQPITSLQGSREPSSLEKLISTLENVSKLTHKLNHYDQKAQHAKNECIFRFIRSAVPP